MKSVNTVCEILESCLKTMYAARDRDVSHQDRWIYRGAFLVLWTALRPVITWNVPLASSTPTTSQLWYGIVEGAMDSEQMIPAALALLEKALPERDAAELIAAIDNLKPFCDDDKFCVRLRDLLFPELD